MKEQIEKAELQEFVITLSDCQHKYDKEVNKAIIKGTPLPKENKFYARYLTEQGYRKQKEGEWIGEADGYADGELVYDVWHCSECNHCIDDGTDDADLLPNFCPNCGAHMKGGAE